MKLVEGFAIDADASGVWAISDEQGVLLRRTAEDVFVYLAPAAAACEGKCIPLAVLRALDDAAASPGVAP
jgi:hypothetical protein